MDVVKTNKKFIFNLFVTKVLWSRSTYRNGGQINSSNKCVFCVVYDNKIKVWIKYKYMNIKKKKEFFHCFFVSIWSFYIRYISTYLQCNEVYCCLYKFILWSIVIVSFIIIIPSSSVCLMMLIWEGNVLLVCVLMIEWQLGGAWDLLAHGLYDSCLCVSLIGGASNQE